MTIAVVGKYTGLKDAYKSLIEALVHGGIANKVQGQARLDRERDFRGATTPRPISRACTASSCPAASASAARRARSWRRASRASARCPISASASACRWPCIEAARSLAGLDKANSTEFGPTHRAGRRPDDRMDARATSSNSAQAGGDLGGTMRLGAYRRACSKPGSTHRDDLRRHANLASATGTATRSTPPIASALEEGGLIFAGMSPDGLLPETVEFADHPWFIGVQFHPELKSPPVRAASAVRELHRRRGWSKAGWCSARRAGAGSTKVVSAGRAPGDLANHRAQGRDGRVV